MINTEGYVGEMLILKISEDPVPSRAGAQHVRGRTLRSRWSGHNGRLRSKAALGSALGTAPGTAVQLGVPALKKGEENQLNGIATAALSFRATVTNPRFTQRSKAAVSCLLAWSLGRAYRSL